MMDIAANVATKVAIRQGIKMSVGLVACNDARIAMMLVGIRVNPDACKQRNIICALDAVSLFGFNSCKLCMAFNPKGVAALSRFKRLAEKFNIICPNAGCPFGTSGNNFEKKGAINLDNSLTPPAVSAILINPMNKAIMPTKFKARSTADLQVATIPSELC